MTLTPKHRGPRPAPIAAPHERSRARCTCNAAVYQICPRCTPHRYSRHARHRLSTVELAQKALDTASIGAPLTYETL